MGVVVEASVRDFVKGLLEAIKIDVIINPENSYCARGVQAQIGNGFMPKFFVGLFVYRHRQQIGEIATGNIDVKVPRSAKRHNCPKQHRPGYKCPRKRVYRQEGDQRRQPEQPKGEGGYLAKT